MPEYAAISMTTDREVEMDFLPPYYESGLKIMTRVDKSISNLIWRGVTLLFKTIMYILSFVVFIIYILAPIAWFSELGFTGHGHIPIFINEAQRRYNRSHRHRGSGSRSGSRSG